MKSRHLALFIFFQIYSLIASAVTDEEVIRNRRVTFENEGNNLKLKSFGGQRAELSCGDCYLHLDGAQIFRINFQRQEIDNQGVRRPGSARILSSCKASHDAFKNYFSRGVSKPGIHPEKIEDCFSRDIIESFRRKPVNFNGADFMKDGKLPIVKNNVQIGFFQMGKTIYHPLICFEAADNCKKSEIPVDGSIYQKVEYYSSANSVARLMQDKVSSTQICGIKEEAREANGYCRLRVKTDQEELDLNLRCKWKENKFIVDTSGARCGPGGTCIGIVECNDSFVTASCPGQCTDKLSNSCKISGIN